MTAAQPLPSPSDDDAERALRVARHRVATVLEATGAGLWQWNASTGEVGFNEALAAILGYTLAELLPQGLAGIVKLTHPDDRAVARQALLRHFKSGGPHAQVDLRMLHKRGHWVWVLLHGRVMSHSADGRAEWVYGVQLDITERVEQRRALEAARERLASAAASGGIGIWGYDIATRVFEFDRWVCRAYGLEGESARMPLDAWLSHVHPDDRERLRHGSRSGITEGRDYETEFRIVRADGRVRHLRATGRLQYDAAGRPERIDGANWDVTEVRELTAQLNHQNELLRVTLHSIGDAVVTTDAEGRINWLNPTAERMTGWSAADARQRPLFEVVRLIDEGSGRLVTALQAEPGESGEPETTAAAGRRPLQLVSRDGREYGIKETASSIRDAAGASIGMVLVLHDVTEQRRLANEMIHRASHDALTGLINRTEFEARLARVLQRRSEPQEHALLFLDLDQFKLVNDACGHAVGDELLRQVSRMLKQAIRSRDTLARLGGDEFGILLEHCTVEQAQRVAQKICDRMDDFRFVHEQRRFRLGTSIGLVPLTAHDWATPDALLQAADTSCYAAKEAGRNRVHLWFDADRQVRLRRGDTNWATRLEQAVDEDQFVLYAQRIGAACSSPRGVYAEALIRLRDGDGGLIAPGAFLGAAERFRLSARIDRWVLGRSLEHLAGLPTLEGIDTLSINLSGQSVGDRAFHRHAQALLSAAGPAVCRRVCLEITETAAVTNLADASQFIEEVRALGVRIALDDFGAGASSFGYLKSLKIDLLKIDGQFIRDLLDDPLDDVAVRCFVDVARVVGVKTVAEFVDRREVLDRLYDLGVDYAQGFLLHKPEPIENVLGRALDTAQRPAWAAVQTPSVEEPDDRPATDLAPLDEQDGDGPLSPSFTMLSLGRD
ncbi:MAG TPA: EAL domain-containing protein [Methylibium sp.]|uniref:EAL domain-containing protein n=1 Tax=Methylibium sp. TaxID=2067992 RepID=UPI002DB5CFDA|nr:EAL domain-containing protein [Methylibium sp.]HEU4460794.1 EAL domain-containing protein [Methylibium sp.]